MFFIGALRRMNARAKWMRNSLAVMMIAGMASLVAPGTRRRLPRRPRAPAAARTPVLRRICSSCWARILTGPDGSPRRTTISASAIAFGFLKKDPFGDELTAAYTFENAGSGFWSSKFGSDTESIGLMKNFGLPKTKRVSGYTWIQIGVTSFTGGPAVQNRFYKGESLGAVVHFNEHNSITGFRRPSTSF